MLRFSPFRAGMYADPTNTVNEGAVDVSTVVTSDGELGPETLAQPSEWARAAKDGYVEVDSAAHLYVVRAGWKDEKGRACQSAGVVGTTSESFSLLTQPATIAISDSAFSELLVPAGVPLVRCTTNEGWHFRVWRLGGAGVIDTIADAVERLSKPTISPFLMATTEPFLVPPGLLFYIPGNLFDG